MEGADACPTGCLERVGKEWSVEDVLREVLKDKAFYDNSGGGVTLSGGEVLCQADFAAELESVVGHINSILATIEQEDGSVGKLLNDKELYDNLTSASDNLSTLLEDLKENPHRYINISVFGANPTKKVEKAKAKAEKHAIKRADELAEKEHEQQIKELKKGE